MSAQQNCTKCEGRGWYKDPGVSGSVICDCVDLWTEPHRPFTPRCQTCGAKHYPPCEDRDLRPACFDCGLFYESLAFQDLVVPDDVWALISPTSHGGGLLCPNCLIRRCAEAGIECTAKFTSGPFATTNTEEPTMTDLARLRDLLNEKFETLETEMRCSEDGPYLTAKIMVDGKLRHLALHRVATAEEEAKLDS